MVQGALGSQVSAQRFPHFRILYIPTDTMWYPAFALRVLPVSLIFVVLVIMDASSGTQNRMFSLVLFAGLTFAQIIAQWIGTSPGFHFTSPYTKCGKDAFMISPPFLPAHLPWSTVTYAYLCTYIGSLILISSRALYNMPMLIGCTAMWMGDAFWILHPFTSSGTPEAVARACYGWREVAYASAIGGSIGVFWAVLVGKCSISAKQLVLYHGK